MNSTKMRGYFDFRIFFWQIWKRSKGSLTLVILGVCVIVFATTAFLDISGLVSREYFFCLFGFSYMGVIQRFWLHQILTAPLLHSGISHFLFNMLTLWMLGPSIEKKLGRKRYFLFSALCAISGEIGFLLVNWGTGNPLVGYSGIVFGILVAQAIYFPDSIVHLFVFFPLKMKNAVILLGAIELYLTLSPERGGIAHAAHLFGAVGSFIYLKLYLDIGRCKPSISPGGKVGKKRIKSGWGLGKKGPSIPKEL